MIVDIIGRLSEEVKGKSFTFVLVVGTTDVSLIPGITVAGASPELTMFTPAADAEFLMTGRCRSIDVVPITPDGIPTPALISRASLSLVKTNKLVVNAGSRVKPRIPHLDLGGEPGGDIRKWGVREEVGETILENAKSLGENLQDEEFLVVGESIPAGTTTAAATLEALGYRGVDVVSSSSPANPKDLKRRVVSEALKNGPVDSRKLIFKVTDPVILGIVGLVSGYPGKVLLAGGTQMTAVAALLKEWYPDRLKDITIGTTRWIVKDPTARIVDFVKEIGVRLSFADVDFSLSRHEGLRVYERGFVKEGVGAGGSMIMALSRGVSPSDIVNSVDDLYSKLTQI
ncbi:TIGR00303 family protein [Metallosphaera yellowstonensis MK1]|uniref:UPF0284 protein MetMK1DRAFT_00012650 n=1 Tax=Metallosphaera yellowstonensis MK1 TaxID=671065 RepID=H2C3E1_9CREN|nr:TIGR00303 family protein [Metallosphaera yellowstonensis MK1]